MTETPAPRKIRLSNLQPGTTVARPDTYEFPGREFTNWACGMTTAKAARRIAKGDTVTVADVQHGERFTATGHPIKGWDMFVTFTDGTTLRASSNMNTWEA